MRRPYWTRSLPRLARRAENLTQLPVRREAERRTYHIPTRFERHRGRILDATPELLNRKRFTVQNTLYEKVFAPSRARRTGRRTDSFGFQQAPWTRWRAWGNFASTPALAAPRGSGGVEVRA